MFDDVGEFHQKILNQDFPKPQLLPSRVFINRYDFLMEELLELESAHAMGDIVGAADALADLVYVALGTAYQMGIPMNQVWAAVQRANMAKVPGVTKRNMGNDATKPDGWVGPEADIQVAIDAATTRS
jgi:predicted HAD superfamily Cof-like phosphohydrolase